MDHNNSLKDRDSILFVIGLLQNLLTEEDVKPVTKPSKSNTIKRNKPKANINTTKKEVKTISNRFLSMPEKDMHKEDVAIDKILNGGKSPTVRSRKYSTVDVTCRSCGKKENVSSVLIYDSVDRYKCNGCSKGAG